MVEDRSSHDPSGRCASSSSPSDGTISPADVSPAARQANGVVPREEWQDFMRALREPLPACFRIHAECAFKDE